MDQGPRAGFSGQAAGAADERKNCVLDRPLPFRTINPAELRIELLRKSIHLLIAFVPLLLYFSRAATGLILLSGTLAYAVCESLRMGGRRVPLISTITEKAARIRDSGKFVMGPVTLGIGGLLSVLLFDRTCASMAVCALAFGDGLSSLAGKTLGRIRLPFTRGKSLEGSLTCLTAVFLSSWAFSGNPFASVIVALATTIVEAMPLKDWDNIVVPLAAGLAAALSGA